MRFLAGGLTGANTLLWHSGSGHLHRTLPGLTITLTPTLRLAVEGSDSGGAGLEDALEQASERHGSGGMPAVELLRAGRELFVQVRRALQPLTTRFFCSWTCVVGVEPPLEGSITTCRWHVLGGALLARWAPVCALGACSACARPHACPAGHRLPRAPPDFWELVCMCAPLEKQFVYMQACGMACRHQLQVPLMSSDISCEMRQAHLANKSEAALALGLQVLCARGVLAMDMNGLSDPYCKARQRPLSLHSSSAMRLVPAS